MATSKIKWTRELNRFGIEGNTQYSLMADNKIILARIQPGGGKGYKRYFMVYVSSVEGKWNLLNREIYHTLYEAKRAAEKYFGVKITQKKQNDDYGIKGDWRPFEGM